MGGGDLNRSAEYGVLLKLHPAAAAATRTLLKGGSALRGGGGMGGFEDIFNMFTGGGFGGGQRQTARGADIEQTINLSFLDVRFYAEINVQIAALAAVTRRLTETALS